MKGMKKGHLVFVLILAVFLLVGARLASADTGPLDTGSNHTGLLQNPLGGSCNDLSCPIKAVTDFLFTISIPLVGIFILVGGFQMITAAGNPERFSKGKKTILYAVVGFVVVILAGSVASLIRNIFSGS